MLSYRLHWVFTVLVPDTYLLTSHRSIIADTCCGLSLVLIISLLNVPQVYLEWTASIVALCLLHCFKWSDIHARWFEMGLLFRLLSHLRVTLEHSRLRVLVTLRRGKSVTWCLFHTLNVLLLLRYHWLGTLPFLKLAVVSFLFKLLQIYEMIYSHIFRLLMLHVILLHNPLRKFDQTFIWNLGVDCILHFLILGVAYWLIIWNIFFFRVTIHT